MGVTMVTTTHSGKSIEECVREAIAIANNMGNKVIWDHGPVRTLIIPHHSVDEALIAHGIVLSGLFISAYKGITKAKEVGHSIQWKIDCMEVMISPTDEPDDVLREIERKREGQTPC